MEHSLFYGNKLFPICQGDKYVSDGLQRAKAEYQKKNKLGPSDRDFAAMDAQGGSEHVVPVCPNHPTLIFSSVTFCAYLLGVSHFSQLFTK